MLPTLAVLLQVRLHFGGSSTSRPCLQHHTPLHPRPGPRTLTATIAPFQRHLYTRPYATWAGAMGQKVQEKRNCMPAKSVSQAPLRICRL